MNYSKEFQEIFLDNWWHINPDSYEEYWKEGISGNEMMEKLAKSNFDLFWSIYKVSSKESHG